MLILYYKPSCPFCQLVLEEADKIGVSFDLRDIYDDEIAMAELLEKGGKKQVPYLVDEKRNVSMYESSDIVAYIKEHYTADINTNRPRVHVSKDVCLSCEG